MAGKASAEMDSKRDRLVMPKSMWLTRCRTDAKQHARLLATSQRPHPRRHTRPSMLLRRTLGSPTFYGSAQDHQSSCQIRRYAQGTLEKFKFVLSASCT
jgi:hypothetical protein